MNKFNRRKFIKSIGMSTVATAAASNISFSTSSSNNYSDNILIFVFLRGGMDGLSLLTPMNDHSDRGNYESLRSHGTMIPSNQLLPIDQGFGLHPAATALRDLYQQNDLAIVRACGLPDYEVNRSHFEAERYAELGTPGERFTNTGWLTRHMQTATNYPSSIPLPVVVAESNVTFSLLREPSAVTLRYPSSFDFDTTTSGNFNDDQEQVLADIYSAGSNELDIAGEQAMAAVEIVEQVDFDVPPSNSAEYPMRPDNTAITSFADKLKTMAQLIKQETGIRIGQADRGGWDTHRDQNNLVVGEGFHEKIRDISETLNAFMTDLDVLTPDGDTWADRTTVLVYSEFGRRAFDNSDAGTDHGWANTSLVLGGGVNGGQQYGQWPGLAPEDLFQGADLKGTVDYRSVWSEILLKRLHNNQIHQIFPGFTRAEYKPLGVVSGSALEPDFNDDPGLMFKDNFE